MSYVAVGCRPRDRTERARLMKPLRTPALTPAMLVENPGNAPGSRCLQGNAALLRDPRKNLVPNLRFERRSRCF